MRAVRIERYGGPEVLVAQEVDAREPGPGEVGVRVEASGVNFIDVYHRTGRYPLPLPLVPGVEGAGTVVAVGPGVTGLAAGDRVGWINHPGSYAERAVVPAGMVVPLPDAVTAQDAAASLLQGATAHYLVTSTYPVAAGDAVLVHAAAGGMGLLLTQLVTRIGGRVLATTSTPEKAELAREAGAQRVVGYGDLPEAAREFTEGAGVPVVYDGVGASTFDASLASLRPRGMLVSYGSASGPVPPVDPMRLSAAGSVFLTRPSLGHYVADRAELLHRTGDVLSWVADGTLRVRVSRRYPLDRAADAHRDLEGRRTTGKLLLLP